MPTDILTMPEAERDRLAAEKVLGWTGDALARWSTFRERFHYGGRLEFDHLILCKVRETWDAEGKERFYHYLTDIWFARLGPSESMGFPMYYEPSDYRDAALAVLAEKVVI